MLDKVIADTHCNIEIAISWCVNAKNSLCNIHGFSPYQLVLGTNPKLPSFMVDQPPALTAKPTSKILAKNLEALHKARESFIACENSERIRRALSHNIRTSGDIKYLTGDRVYFKRANNREWHGPASVIGQDGQQVLVKYGSSYSRVHPCRLQLIPPKHQNHIDDKPDSEISAPNVSRPRVTSIRDPETDSDSENDMEENNTPMLTTTPNEVCMDNFSPSRDQLLCLKNNTHIRYKLNSEDNWQKSRVLSRAGKATGKNATWWNIEDDEGQQKSVDFSKVSNLQVSNPTMHTSSYNESPENLTKNLPNLSLNKSKTINSPDESYDELQVHHTLMVKSVEDIKEAKERELLEWKKENVYSEEDDINQECISLRWVLKEKITGETRTMKARLCARGYEEEQNFCTHSPTCSREGFRFAACIIAGNKWNLNSLDVKTAFLQGKNIERTVYVRPPKEAMTTKVWKLKKCVYGLADASRYWYLKLREELIKLGAKPTRLDQGIFTWHHNNIQIGIMVCYVDDVMWGGEPSFINIVDKLKKSFQIGSENQQLFDYIGIRLTQNPDFSITLDQNTYTQSINLIDIKDSKNNSNRTLTKEETTELRGALGKLNWLAGMSRPTYLLYLL